MIEIPASNATPTTIQNALNQKQVVQVGEGIVNINQTIMLGDGATLRGVGSLTIFKRAVGFKGSLIATKNLAKDVQCLDFAVDDAPNGTDGQPFFGLSDLTCKSQSLFFYGVTGGLIRGITMKNIYRWGICVGQGDNVVIEQCEATGAHGIPMVVNGQNTGGWGGHGILINGGVRHRVSHCTMRDNWRTGFYGIHSTGFAVEDCTFDNNAPNPTAQYGIERGGQIGVAYSCRDFIIENNVITGGYETQGIEIDITENGHPNDAPTQGMVIRQNEISGQGYPGILLYGDRAAPVANRVANALITGNVLTNNNRRGNNWYGAIFAATGISGFVVVDNEIVDDAPNNPAIRARDTLIPGGGPCNNYTIGLNRIRLINRPLTPTMTPEQKAALAVDDLVVAGGVRNILRGVHYVNGQQV